MNFQHEIVQAVTRRYFFGQCGTGLGLGAIALLGLAGEQVSADSGDRGLGREPARAACAPGLPAKRETRHLPAHGRLAEPARPVRRQAGPAPVTTASRVPHELLKGKAVRVHHRAFPTCSDRRSTFAKHGQSGIEAQRGLDAPSRGHRRIRRRQVDAHRPVQPRAGTALSAHRVHRSSAVRRWARGRRMVWARRTRTCRASSS